LANQILKEVSHVHELGKRSAVLAAKLDAADTVALAYDIDTPLSSTASKELTALKELHSAEGISGALVALRDAAGDYLKSLEMEGISTATPESISAPVVEQAEPDPVPVLTLPKVPAEITPPATVPKVKLAIKGKKPLNEEGIADWLERMLLEAKARRQYSVGSRVIGTKGLLVAYLVFRITNGGRSTTKHFVPPKQLVDELGKLLGRSMPHQASLRKSLDSAAKSLATRGYTPLCRENFKERAVPPHVVKYNASTAYFWNTKVDNPLLGLFPKD
jgi:hypothetical protein